MKVYQIHNTPGRPAPISQGGQRGAWCRQRNSSGVGAGRRGSDFHLQLACWDDMEDKALPCNIQPSFRRSRDKSIDRHATEIPTVKVVQIQLMHRTGEPKDSLAGQKEPSSTQQMTTDNRGWTFLHFSGLGIRAGSADRRHPFLPGSQPLKQGQGLIKTCREEATRAPGWSEQWFLWLPCCAGMRAPSSQPQKSY